MNPISTNMFPMQTDFNSAEWMKNCADKISSTKLCQLPLPGSHDAGSYGALKLRSHTQEKSVAEQLQFGVRCFDFRVNVDKHIYFSHHGLDHSRDVVFVNAIEPQSNTVFEQITNFCHAHTGEIIILCFNDFWRFKGTGLVDGYATDDQKKIFFESINTYFGSLLIPKSASIPTYGECIENQQQVMVIINEVNNPYSFLWSKSDCMDDHYSAYNSATNRSWEKLSDLTIEDQQNFLINERNLDRFCVTQSILNYKNEMGTTIDNDHHTENSRNYAGAQRMNPKIIEAYTQWWGGHAVPSDTNKKVKRPNILLLDFSGVYDQFPETCASLLGPVCAH
jgi:hypothetical protein